MSGAAMVLKGRRSERPQAKPGDTELQELGP